MFDPPNRTLVLDGETFDLVDLGAGKIVIFLHGALGDYRTFQPHCRILADSCRAITYSQRHFGQRHWDQAKAPFGIETHAKDLVHLVEALDCGPVHVVAWSYAGHAALTGARNRPDLFSSTLVYESGFQTFMTDKEDAAKFRTEIAAMFGPILEAAGRGDNEAAARALVDGSAGRAGFFDSQSPASRKIQIDNAATMPLLLAQTPPPKITADDLASLSVPVTFVSGAMTHPAYALVARAARQALGGDRHREIPGAGHFWPDEDPAGFSALVADWLAGV